MASLQVRKDGGERREMARGGEEFEPLHALRSLLRWDPFREMTRGLGMPELSRAAVFEPAFELRETKDGYLLTADLPGVNESDIDVTLTGNRLTINGKREAERRDESDACYVYERSFGSFSRSFTMPEGIDQNAVQAKLDNGVLTVSVGKQPEQQAKRIAIGSSKSKS